MVRRIASRVRPAVPGTGRRGHVHPARSGAAAKQLPGTLAPERRGAHGRPHLHLQPEEGAGGPDQQLDRPARDALHSAAAVRRLHAWAHDVRDAVLDGADRLAYRADRRRDFRFGLRGGEHAHYDAHGSRSGRPVGRKRGFRALRSLGRRAARRRRPRRTLAEQRDGKVDRAFSGTHANLVLRLRLWRQCAPRQEVPGAAHRFGHGT